MHQACFKPVQQNRAEEISKSASQTWRFEGLMWAIKCTRKQSEHSERCRIWWGDPAWCVLRGSAVTAGPLAPGADGFSEEQGRRSTLWEGVRHCYSEKWWKRMCFPDCAKGQHVWEDWLSPWCVGELFLCSGLQFLAPLPEGNRRKKWQPVRNSKRKKPNTKPCRNAPETPPFFSVGLASCPMLFAPAQRAQVALSRMSVSSSSPSLTRLSQGWCLSPFSKVFRTFPVLHNTDV